MDLCGCLFTINLEKLRSYKIMGEEIVTYQINGAEKQWLSDLLEKHSIRVSGDIMIELIQTVDRIAKEAYEKGKKRK